MRSNTERGLVKKTHNQIKKHHSQFTTDERKMLEHIVESFKYTGLNVSQHATNHIDCFTSKMAMEAIEKCRVIEFNFTCKDDINSARVLVRSSNTMKIELDGVIKPVYTCMVIDIKEARVITAYFNERTDNHSTLDMSRYNENIDIAFIAKNI